MTVYKNNRGKWCIDVEWVHPNGKTQRIRKTSPIQTERGAERYERNVRQALSDGVFGKEEVAVPTIEGFKDSFFEWSRAKRHKPSTLEVREVAFRKHILPLFGKRKLDSFGPADEQKLRERLSELSIERYNFIAGTINKLLNVAKDQKKSDAEFRFERLKIVKRPKPFYDFGTYERVLAAARRLGTTAECVVLLGAEASCRRSEMLPLRRSSCNLDTRRLSIETGEVVIRKERHKGTPKGGNYRTVPMSARLIDAIKRHPKNASGLLLVDDDGQPFTPGTFRTLVERIQREAGVEVTGAGHIFRHTFCSHLAMRGVPVMVIKQLAGHSKIETTLDYMHLAPGEADRAIDTFGTGYGNGAATAAE